MSKTTLETIKVKVGDIGHGELFWIGDDDLNTHIRLSNKDPYLNHKPGKIYSVSRGVLYEHSEEDEVSYLKILRS